MYPNSTVKDHTYTTVYEQQEGRYLPLQPCNGPPMHQQQRVGSGKGSMYPNSTLYGCTYTNHGV